MITPREGDPLSQQQLAQLALSDCGIDFPFSEVEGVKRDDDARKGCRLQNSHEDGSVSLMHARFVRLLMAQWVVLSSAR